MIIVVIIFIAISIICITLIVEIWGGLIEDLVSQILLSLLFAVFLGSFAFFSVRYLQHEESIYTEMLEKRANLESKIEQAKSSTLSTFFDFELQYKLFEDVEEFNDDHKNLRERDKSFFLRFPGDERYADMDYLCVEEGA